MIIRNRLGPDEPWVFLISSHQCWLPGIYADERAARLAFKLSDVSMQPLQDMANERNGGVDGVLTYDDVLAEYRRQQVTNDAR